MTVAIESEATAANDRLPNEVPPDEKVSPASKRLVSLDAYRGLVMVLMVSAGLQITDVVHNFEKTPELHSLKTPLWERLAFHTDHVAWAGCGLWDLIQPSFMFLVGSAMAFSLASRRGRGQSFGRMLVHAIFRSVVLVLLGIFLTSNWTSRTDWVFTNVLSQIGIGYTFLFLVAWLKPRWQLATVGLILVAYWAAFAIHRVPESYVSSASLHLPADWARQQGFSAHWEKNVNLAARFDGWFLNLFPREDEKPYTFNRGGYATLNFVPSLATMILGLLAGELVRSRMRAARKLLILFAAGLCGLGLGWAIARLGLCPIVKRIWTPSWTIFSAGWCFLSLSFFYLVIDVARLKRWAYPLVVVGMNSITIYCMAQLLKPWVRDTMKRHFGPHVYEPLGRAVYAIRAALHPGLQQGLSDAYAKAFAPMAEAGFFLLVCWAVCWWMYRRKIFLKI